MGLRAVIRPLVLLLALAAQPLSGLHLPSAQLAPTSTLRLSGGGDVQSHKEPLPAFAPSTGPTWPRRGVPCSPGRAIPAGIPGRCPGGQVLGRRRVVIAQDQQGKGGKGGGDDEDEDLTPIDKLFKPLVREYAKLGDEEQKFLSTVYQSLYFILCIYVGVVMVRAYKAWYFSQGGF